MTMTFANGQPCWMDISVQDAEAREGLMAFLADLFGWTFEVGDEDTGYYTMAHLDGAPVCAIGEQEGGGGMWVTYLSVDDAVDARIRVAAQGGQVLMGPTQVMDAGWMSVAVDPTGAVFGMWQAGDFSGFGAFGRVGAPCWFDHQSPSPRAASDFYSAAFGLELQPVGDEGMGMLGRGGATYASVSRAPGDMPPGWTVVVAVASIEAAETTAVELGATVLMSGMTVPGGVVTVVADPVVGSTITLYESPDMAS